MCDEEQLWNFDQAIEEGENALAEIMCNVMNSSTQWEDKSF